MNKQSQEQPANEANYTWSERNPIKSVALKSLAAGGSVAAISAMIADVLEAKRQRDEEKKRKNRGISEDTVVLRIRKPGTEKAAQACEGSCKCNPAECDGEKVVGEECRVVPKVEPTSEEREISYQGQDSQPRTKDGKYSTLGKVAAGDYNPNLLSWQDLLRMVGNGENPRAKYTWGQTLGAGMQIAAVPVFGTLGYFAVDALHQKLEANRLKKQLAAAQQEYVDLLDGKKVKTAEAFGKAFLFDVPMSKEANAVGDWIGRRARDAEDIVRGANDTGKASLSSIIAAMLLTGGTSAWLTHKVLASKFDKKDEEEEPNKVTKVMFKEFSDKSDPGFKLPKLMFKAAEGEEFEITPEQFLCTVEVLRDCIRDSEPATEKTAGAFGDWLGRKTQRAKQVVSNVGQAVQEGAIKATAPLVSRMVPWDDVLRNYAMGDGEVNMPGWAKDTMMKYMKEDPRGWFESLGKEQNADVRQALLDRHFKNNGGFMSTLYNMPVIGGLFKNFLFNTQWGRRIMARHSLMNQGMTQEQADAFMSDYDFSGNRWARNGQQQASSPAPDKPVAKAKPPAVPSKPAPAKPAAPAPAPVPAKAAATAPAKPAAPAPYVPDPNMP